MLSGPTVVGMAAAAGRSQELARILRDANDSGILPAPELASLGKAHWTVSNLAIQPHHAPSGRIVWQSVGDCTEYVESVAASGAEAHPVPELASDPGAYWPPDKPEIEPEPAPPPKAG